MSIDQLLARAQTILKESEYAVASMEEALSKSEESAADNFRVPRIHEGLKFYKCGGSYHFSWECRS